jgi:signal transduction histidine kinase
MSEGDHHAGNLEAARCVEHRRDEILAEWLEQVSKWIEGAEEIDEPALIDDVPEILVLVADALRKGTTTALSDFEPVRAHGEQRAALTHTDIRWVLKELHLLRAVVIDEIEGRFGELGRKGLVLIYDVFEQVTTVSIEAYANWHLKKAEDARVDAEAHASKLSKLTEMLEAEREQRVLFVSAVVHDLRTPLASMQMATDLLENFADRPGVRERALEKLQRSIRRLDAMAQRLLDVNRISAGSRLPLGIEQVELVEVTRGYVKDAQSTHGADAVSLEVLVGGDASGEDASGEDASGEDASGEIRGWWNREALLRILSNLVENGIKYGEPPVTVRIRTDPNDDEHDEVSLEVHNEGPPIPPEDQERIFERFVRLKSAQQKNKSGWGIGLTLVRGLTDAMGGRLELDSSEEAGTTFAVWLPRDARPFQQRDE